ncbi:flagellar hook capping FlgD N-terminal domain-containing protein [Paracoccus methylarcula]|uniref:Basal-body rod modification protein FlgD n=1 Tax=Paracoccus methylarcula TaxID=72022 RepID=A0A3R7P4E9_9RHOB|nr:flagellar hook capping FlgD N-terminal domain-containing protein [Paracoccus methylarcula]RNF34443.1 flagellar basal body rod modification protein [Paracoccus methylarcula]
MITPTDNKTVTGTAASTPAAPGITTNADFSTFLRLLTTQLQNQDPLNPMEGSEFAVQLATFSGVEQQAYTNKLLGEMMTQAEAGGLGQAASWIGKEARSTAPVWFGDEALTLDITPDPRAEDVTLITMDATGREILREAIGTGTGEVEWYGRDASGQKLPDGRYSFRIESILEGDVIADDEVGAYARIEAVRSGPNGTELVFAHDASALLTDIDALRQPE